MPKTVKKNLTENQKNILLALNRDGHKVYKTGEIVEVVNFTRRTAHNNLNKLIENDLVKKVAHGKYKLTKGGKDTLKEIEEPVVLVEPEVQNKRIKGFEEKLPSEPHQAAFELAISVIYAKQNLFNNHERGWPSLILYGPTKTYKTGVAEDIVKAVGVDPAEAVKNLETATPGEIGGRHDNNEGEWTMETSYVLDYPVFVFDELDEASKQIKNKVKVYLQSKSSAVAEGEKIDLPTVPIVTLNTEKIEDVLPNSFIRRSFLMDTTGLDIQENIALQADEIKKSLSAPLCNPQRAKYIEFPDNLLESVQTLYQPFVKDQFWNEQGDPLPAMIALEGRMLSPLSTGDPQRDLVHNAYRILQLTETRGKTVDNWRAEFNKRAENFTDNAELQKAFAEKEKKAESQREEIEGRKEDQQAKADEAEAEKVEKITEQYEFTLAKEDIISKLKKLRNGLYPLGDQDANEDARPAREMVDKLINDLEKVKTRENLETHARAFQEVKQDPKFRKGVKVAIKRRARENNLKPDGVDWDYFIDEKEVESIKREAGASDKEGQVPEGARDRRIKSETNEKGESKNELKKSKSSSGSSPSKSPTPAMNSPMKIGFLRSLMNFGSWGSDKVLEFLVEKSSDDEEPQDEETSRYKTFEDLRASRYKTFEDL